MKPIFITGTGTDVGKTIVSAIVTEALQADYWKPVQAGFADGTDSLLIQQLISNKQTVVHKEAFKLKMPASPHLAAPAEKKIITIKNIMAHLPITKNHLVIEGAGGLMVPFSETEFTLDLIKKLKARVIVVSKNELGSINHSLLTAAVLRKEKVDVVGWIFNGQYKNYESDIEQWSGIKKIASIKQLSKISKEEIKIEAKKIRLLLLKFL
ncbi:MAG: dethiobiotin synthase [Ginsengibacter sp.]